MTDDEAAGKPAASHRSHKRPPKRKWWQRPLVWVTSVLTALVLAAATAVGTGLGQDLLNVLPGGGSPTAPKPGHTAAVRVHLPVQIETAKYFQSAGGTFAFPRALSPGRISSLIKSSGNISNVPGDMESYMGLVDKYGGAPSTTLLQIVLRNVASQTAVITNIQLVKRCGPPLTGTLMFSPDAGAVGDINLAYNLDSPSSPALNGHGSNRPFFGGDTLKLVPREVDTLIVNVTTERQFCQFTFRALVDYGDRQITETISNRGRPFVADATPAPIERSLSSVWFSDYRALYIGGVANPHPNSTTFEKVNPKTYNPFK